VSIGDFFAEVLSATELIDKWMNYSWQDPGEPTTRETLIDQSWQLTPLEKRILKTDSELLISMRVLLFEPVSTGVPFQEPEKEIGPGPP
jgi:hypothetical protein